MRILYRRKNRSSLQQLPVCNALKRKKRNAQNPTLYLQGYYKPISFGSKEVFLKKCNIMKFLIIFHQVIRIFGFF